MRKTSRKIVALVMSLLLVFVAACTTEEGTTLPTTPENGSPTTEPTTTGELGTIEVRVTDPPAAENITSIVVYLKNLEVHKAGAEQEQEQEQSGSENQTQEQEQSNSENQTQEQEQEQEQESGGEWITIIGAPPSFDLMKVLDVAAILGSANVTAGSFTQIRMDVDRVEVTTAAGDNFTAEVPSDKLKIVRPFNVSPGLKTVLTLDFDGSQSLIITGNGTAKFKPVVKLLIEK